MPSVSQLYRYMSASSKLTSTSTLDSDLKFSAAMPLHALGPLEAQPIFKQLQFTDHMRIIKDTGFGMPSDEEMGSLGEELDSILESEFDEAAVPTYQLISTFDRKKLKMKKH